MAMKGPLANGLPHRHMATRRALYYYHNTPLWLENTHSFMFAHLSVYVWGKFLNVYVFVAVYILVSGYFGLLILATTNKLLSPGTSFC